MKPARPRALLIANLRGVNMPIQNESKSAEPLDLLWGTEEIAAAIKQTTIATSHLLWKRKIPARKIGSRWVISRAVLKQFFENSATV